MADTSSAARLPTLAVAATGAHLADQLILAALPLLLAAGDASPGVISAVVAAQAAAWLVVSLPAGALADRLSRRSIMLVGAVLIVIGTVLGWFAVSSGHPSPALLGLAGFVCSAGVVLEVLSVFALLPGITSGHGIARANATLEFFRAVMALAAPVVASLLVARGASAWVFAIAVAGALVSLMAVRRLPDDPPAAVQRASLAASIAEGARFVARDPILRAIAVCAICWNFAFFALTAVFAPFAMRVAGLGVEAVGHAWAAYGAGLLLGAALAPIALRTIPTGLLFVFGPGMSLICVGILAAFASGHGAWPTWIGLFGVGFGPMLWLVLQTSVRQILTPPAMLGRVAATISTAIYGIRPIGALAAGAVSEFYGLGAAVWLAVGFFALSTLAILASPAPRLRELPTAPIAA